MEVEKLKSPLQIIRKHCLECSNDQYSEVEKCPCETCTLWPYRFGRNPYRAKKILSPEHREKLRQSLEARKTQCSHGPGLQETKITGIAEQEFADWMQK